MTRPDATGESGLPDLHDRLAAIFAAALDLPPGERKAFVDAASGDSPDLHTELRALLAAHDAGGEFLEVLDPSGVAGLLEMDEPVLVEGQRIGAWRVLGELGHGGMGAVYQAERSDGQFEQRVALKVVRAGVASAAIHARFLRERRILARLEHPNIARLLDGGITDAGLPYLVMEYVEGRPIDRYCEEERLSIDRRLLLFDQACSAVAWAHRNLIVHRDIKPANILVSSVGGVKLLDFGVAKLIEPDTSDAAGTATGLGVRMLTPEYASPEQFLGQPVSTASDVYSLGVLLYELLAGIRPHGATGRAPRADAEPAPPDRDPEPPSLAFLHAKTAPLDPTAGDPVPDAPARIAHARATTTDALRRRLRGDLDGIVLTAMRREPEARYASVDALRADIRRHLGGQPVTARPATRRYRTAKFLARNRAAVLVALLLVAVVVSGIITVLAQARAAARAGRRAEQIRDFLVAVFEVADPNRSRGETITARELLDQGAARIDRDLANQPELHASMLAVLGTVYRQLGLYTEARPVFERALALRRDGAGTRHDLAESLTDLGALLVNQAEYDDAETLVREAIDLRRNLNGPRSAEVAAVTLDLAGILRARGEYENAEPLYREALALHRAAGDSGAVAGDLNGFGLMLTEAGRHVDGIPLLEQAVVLQRQVHGDIHTETALSLCNLAYSLGRTERLDEAIAKYRECLAIRRQLLDDAHPDLGRTLNNLATIHVTRGEYDLAEPLHTEALAIRRRAYGEQHPEVAGSLNNLAVIAYSRGQHAVAAERFREIREMWRALVGENHPNTLTTANNLGVALREAGDLAGSEAVLRETLATRREALGEDHPNVGESLLNLAITVERRGRLDEAESMLRDAGKLLDASFADGHPLTATVEMNLGRLLHARLRTEEALPHLERAVRLRTGIMGATNVRTGEAQLWLGRCLDTLRRFDEAEAALAAAHSAFTAGYGPDHKSTREAADALKRVRRRRAS